MSPSSVPFVDLGPMHDEVRSEIDAAIAESVEKGDFILGAGVGEFEQDFADYCGVKHAIAVNNGTTALHLALVALDLQPGDEVLIPAFTYIATANAVTYCGATPVLVEAEPRTMNLDVADLEAKVTPKTKGIIPVHLYGHPADMDGVRKVAERHNLWVVEDAAEALGARYKGVRTGALSDCATFSFFGNKIITTGEGGMVTTDDEALAARLRLFRGQGMDPQRRYWFPVIGYNYRMTNIAAAIGLGQLERLDHHLSQRARVAHAYEARLAGLKRRLVLPTAMNWAQHAYWMYTVVLTEAVAKSRDQVMAELDALGIETRPVFHPMHQLPPYQERADGRFPIAERLGARGLNLPTFGALQAHDIDRIGAALEHVLG